MQFLLLLLALLLSALPFSLSSPPYNLTKGSSLSVEKNKDVLISENLVFSAGFYQVGKNAYCFSIWYTHKNDTIVWMANRDKPVNGKRSKLTLTESGDLILKDAGKISFWSTGTTSTFSTSLQINDNGNLVLQNLKGEILWQSFDSPTDTLLPEQNFTENTALISSRSQNNFSSGFYKFFFDDNNVLRIAFRGLEATSVFWPSPWLLPFEAGRTTYNYSRIAVLDSDGFFGSSDGLWFLAADFGKGPQRRLKIDSDGNIRLYSSNTKEKGIWQWRVQWQAISQPCMIHGVCGANSFCSSEFGRRCSCLPGYKIKNHTDWAYGCKPDFKICEHGEKVGFIQLPHVEFYGYDDDYLENYTLEGCKKMCLKQCSCLGFQFKFDNDYGYYICITKGLLLNGYRSTSFNDSMYIKLPRSVLNSSHKLSQEFHLNCANKDFVQLERSYKKKSENESVKFMLWFTYAFGGFEIICIFFFNYQMRQPSPTDIQSYHQAATGFTRYKYNELKEASRNFSEEIGRGGGGIVYKAVLSDGRIAAIKRLNQFDQGEAEFLAEISIIGRINHMNLIEIWGYCAEGKHRFLVYEYMEHGSLAENLHSNSLVWEKRYEIAVGTAKGLAYLHDECLEWVLHCDVKPQNILLDANYEPKVADFGLSKLLNRNRIGYSSFSKIRGTRGYVAPEWVYNLSITSKVDVYSYGVVMLELITGRSPVGVHAGDDGGGMEQRRLVSWVREKMHGVDERPLYSRIERIVDPNMQGEIDMGRVKVLVQVAMQRVEEDREARPTMSQVVDMLLCGENDD